jgi:methyl-accepting chemotaxis protein
MNALQKKVGLNQAIFFLAVVIFLGIPYILFTLEMTPEQLTYVLTIYAWEGVLFGVLCTLLPMRWARNLTNPDQNREPQTGTSAHMERFIVQAFRFPQKVALTVFFLILFGFAIGVLQVVLFADFNFIQSIEVVIVGIIIALIYAICCFLNNERTIAPYLAEILHKYATVPPPAVLSIFNKVMSVCIAIMIVTILFLVSISYSHSTKILGRKLAGDTIQELLRLKNLMNETLLVGESTEIETNFLKSLETGGNERFFLLERTGAVMAGKPDQSFPLEGVKNRMALFERLSRESTFRDILQNLIYCGVPLNNVQKILVKVIDFGGSAEDGMSLLKRTALISALILTVAFFLSYGLASSVSRPIKDLERAARRIVEGELGSRTKTLSGDEVGALAYSFSIMESWLNRVIGQVKDAVMHISSASNEIAAASQQQASGAAEQASSVGETSATVEELSASARQIAENSEAQAAMAESTLKNAEESQVAMERAAGVMNDIRQRTEAGARKIMKLGEKSQKIGKILGIINDIAAETKMLSLNAAIEASRAGEAGKGFSVVAEEIRKLAENVVKSTGAIEEMLQEIQGAANVSVMAAEESVKVVSSGTVELDKVKTALQEIVFLAEQTTDSAKQVSIATSQQKVASEQTAAAMREISEVTRQTASAASQTTVSVQGLQKLSSELKDLISIFKNVS